MMDRQLAMGLLLLRLGGGGMLAFGRAWTKLQLIRDSQIMFPDPFGIGPELSWAIVMIAEFFCPLFVMLGVATRITAIAPFVAMVLAGAAFPAGTPWLDREVYFLLALPFFVLTWTGGGEYSFDARLTTRAHPYRS